METGLAEVDRCRANILAWIKKLVDSYHGQARSLAYYDLLAGDWVEQFVHQTYAAWREVLLGNAPTERQIIPVSADPAAYAQLCSQHSGLHEHLRWAVARLLEGSSPDDWEFECESTQIASGNGNRLPLRVLRGLAAVRPDIQITAPCFKCSRVVWAGALWRWRHWLAWDNLMHPIRVNTSVDCAWRKARALEVGPVSDLAGVLQVLLPLHLPLALLEGFADYRRQALALPVTRPKVVYSANALHSHLTFKLLVAEWREQGTLLLYHQHGGGYGVDRIHTLEEFEIRVSDRYYTWGWRCEKSHVKPLSAPPPNVPSRSRKRLLLCCADYPRVFLRLHFQPMPGSIQTMHRQTYEFLATLPSRKNLLIRPHPADYGWGQIDVMRKVAPEVTFDDHRVGSFVRYAESRLVIHNYLGTGWLETLALDIPTVCFFDPDTYAFREAAQPFVNALERVGVLHRSGIAAARFVAGLGNNPEAWWKLPDVREARRNFVDHYANFSPDWKKQWESEFEAVLDGAR